jgi:lipoyl(octanoyl) transferase
VVRCDWLGRIDYAEAWQRQLALREAVIAGAAEPQVLLCEHPPVITLGRSAKRDNVLATDEQLAAEGVAVHAIERGGDVTYHGPGQLMIYPVIPIRGVVVFLSAVASALAEVTTSLGVPGAAFRCNPAGLWLGEHKLAACGISVRHGVSIHGWAYNVATPPRMWKLIRPCGGDAPQRSVSEARTLLSPPLPPLPLDTSVATAAAEAAPRLLAALPAVMSPLRSAR